MKIKHIIALVTCMLTLSYCTREDRAENREEAGHREEPAGEEVELNEVQFKNAGIVLGTYEMKNLSEVINTNGYTKLPPQNQADVSALIGGIISNILVIEGQFVKKGQTLATIRSLELNNLRLEREKLQEALQSAKVSKDYLELEFARQKELADEQVNARKIFQKVSSDLQIENNRIGTLQNQIAIVDQTLQMAGNAGSPVLSVTAPIAGYITAVNIRIGSNTEAGKPLFSIVDNSKMHVDLLVYEKDLYKVKVGQHVRFILTNQNNTEIRGKVFSVGKAFANETKSVAVHADIMNEKQTLISGMYVNALIDVGAVTVQALPVDAVIKADGREFIFVLETDHAEDKTYHFHRIEVKTGNTQLGYVQVTPLEATEEDARVVVKGAYYIQSHLLKSESGGGHGH